MVFNEHWGLKDKHAFLSPSGYHWVNYDIEKLQDRYQNEQMKTLGTELHEYAAMAIRLGRKQPRNNDCVNAFVNDAIGSCMTSEQPLFYSERCFGTADAISFNKNLLRIHDLKTGRTPASMMQLMIYAALFCLEYNVKPHDIDMELRIYQSGEKLIHIPEPDEVSDIMVKIVEFDKALEALEAL